MDYLKHSNDGRCVYLMDHDEPGHYATKILFKNNIAAVLPMKAFTGYECKRAGVLEVGAEKMPGGKNHC